jgi:hypothetical protein
MSRPGETESPFKRDEPVSRSRKWMLLLLGCLALVVGMTLVGWILHPPSLGDLDITGFVTVLQGFITVVVCLVVMFKYLWRVAREAKQCREKRSFDMMAATVRTQRRIWMVLALFGAYEVISLVADCLLERPRVKAVQEMLKDRQAKMARQQATPTP